MNRGLAVALAIGIGATLATVEGCDGTDDRPSYATSAGYTPFAVGGGGTSAGQGSPATDAGLDAATDALADAAIDATFDAGIDAGIDATFDATGDEGGTGEDAGTSTEGGTSTPM